MVPCGERPDPPSPAPLLSSTENPLFCIFRKRGEKEGRGGVESPPPFSSEAVRKREGREDGPLLLSRFSGPRSEAAVQPSLLPCTSQRREKERGGDD